MFGDALERHQIGMLPNTDQSHHFPLELLEGTWVLVRWLDFFYGYSFRFTCANIDLTSTAYPYNPFNGQLLPRHHDIPGLDQLFQVWVVQFTYNI